jgi:predicted nucleic acid-binding protein
MIIIADAGPLLHLFWVEALEWALPPQEIVVLETVWREVERYEPDVLQNERLRLVPDTGAVPEFLAARMLDSGEEAALAYALSQPDPSSLLILSDDQQARRACQQFALPVTGTLGLISAAFQAGRVSKETAEAALNELPTRGRFYVKPSLIARTIKTLEN